MEALITALKNGVVEVKFTKVNGNTRTMKCTLQESYLPSQVDLEEAIQNKNSSTNLAVWDIDNNSWRSFRKESIIHWGKV